MLNYGADIQNRSELERLKDENRILKTLLQRYTNYGQQWSFNNLEQDLTEQLHYVEKSYNMLLDNMVASAFTGDVITSDEDKNIKNFVIVEANSRFVEFANRPLEDIIGKTANQLGICNSQVWTSKFFETAETGLNSSSEIIDGENIYKLNVFSTKKGRFCAVFQNINIKVKAELQIKQNLMFLQKTIDAIPTPVFFKDMEGRYIICNQAYSHEVIGVDPEMVIGKTALELDDFFPKEYADLYQEKDIQLIKEQGVQIYQGPIKCADGKTKQYIVTKKLIKNYNVGYDGILGVMQDINGIIKSQRELAESEKRYKILFNGIKQPIIVVDLEGNIIMINSTAVELFEDESDVSINSQAEIPALKFIDKKILAELSNSNNPITTRITVNVNGVERWYLCSMQPINDFFGEKVVQIFANDITEIKHYQSELLEEKKHVEQANNLKTAFLANIAHETRTPINVISGFVQLIQQGISEEKRRDYLNVIFSSCKKLLEIIDDIVELSKIETGQIKVRHEICSINSVLDEAFFYLQETLKEQGKNVAISKTPPLPDNESLVYADGQRISQVLKKLIANAATYTSSGKIEIGVNIEQKLEFFVSDTGIGIPEDKMEVIFEKFRQADEGATRQYGGNGLGLSIASELVARMGGNINVLSKAGNGSKFVFTIPYEKANL